MGRKQLGAAEDFYRVRLAHYDEADAPEFEWREDILWRRPPVQPVGEYEIWRVEAVPIADEEHPIVLGQFYDAHDAHEALNVTEEDLQQLTKTEFENRYIPADE